jgi:competence protein ComEC
MKRPLVILTVFYCFGIILGDLIWVNFWAITATGIIILVVVNLLKRHDYLFLVSILFLMLLNGVANLKNSYSLPKSHIVNFVYPPTSSLGAQGDQGSFLYSLDGFIDSVPEVTNNYTEFIFCARQIQIDKLRWRCCGKVLVKVNFSARLNYGENLALIGNLKRLYGFNVVSKNYKDFLSRQDIYLTTRINDPRQIIRRPGNSGNKLTRYSLWVRAKAEDIIRQFSEDLPASILSAMVLGQKRNVPLLINNSMVKSGTVHILVVSGFNVGIVAFIVNLLFKIMRIPRRWRIILVMVCLIVYCFVTGASNPVIRATIMGIIFLLSYLLKKEPDICSSLAAAALFILVINPRQLFDVGFQLSFASVLAIVYLYPRLKALINPEEFRFRIWKLICEGSLVSFCAWLGTLGIIAFNFHIIAPVTVLANIFVVPLAAIITLCGFTLVLSGLVCPSLANLFSIPTTMLINFLLSLNAAIIKLPFAYFYL